MNFKLHGNNAISHLKVIGSCHIEDGNLIIFHLFKSQMVNLTLLHTDTVSHLSQNLRLLGNRSNNAYQAIQHSLAYNSL